VLTLAIVILAAQASLGLGSTFVQQRFRLLALTTSWERPRRSRHVVWIVEDRSGEGYSSTLLQVVVDSDGVPAVLQTGLKSYGDWQWLQEGVGRLRTEQFQVLSESQGVFSYDNYDVWIQPPAPNEALSQAFRDFGHTGARDWNDAMGIDWDLVYYYPNGLYINYEIAEAYYFPRTRYLLLFTHQGMLADGMDTMHGFMILRLNLDDE
jgi:hypothetical protein